MRGLLFAISVVLLSADASAQFMAMQQDWVSTWGLNGQTEKQFEIQLKSECRMRIKMIDRLCSMEDDQQSKLTLAADADVKRFFREVAAIRAQVEAMDLKGNRNEDINQIWQVVSPLSTKVQEGIFEEKSLFQRVMRSVLSEEQQGLYEAELKKIRLQKWKAITRVNVAELERSMPLLADQREKLVKILDDQDLPKTISKHMDGYVGFLKMARAQKANKKQFEGFLDEKQLKVIDLYCDRYRGWIGM